MTDTFQIPPGCTLLAPFDLDDLTWGDLRMLVQLADGNHDDHESVLFRYDEDGEITDVEIRG